MSSEQVQFCYAIANGQVDRAKELLPRSKFLPERDVFQKDNFEFYSAIFCLSAASQTNSQSLHTNLRDLFPEESEPTPDNLPSREEIRAWIRENFYKDVKSALSAILKNLLTLTKTSDTKRFHFTAKMALEAILNDPFFHDIEPRVKRITQKLHRELTNDHDIAIDPENELHSSMKDQMSLLHQLFSSKEFMPEPNKPPLTMSNTYVPQMSAKKFAKYTLTDRDDNPVLGSNLTYRNKTPH